MRCAWTAMCTMPRRDYQFRKIQEFKERFSNLSNETLILRLKQRNLVREAEIAARELLKARGVPAQCLPAQDEMDPQIKLFWDLIPLLRANGFDEASDTIFFTGLFTGCSRSEFLRAFGQAILRLQRLHSPLAPELQQRLDRCMAEVRKVFPDIKEDPPSPA